VISSAHQLRIRGCDIVASQYTHADPMRRRRRIAVVWQIAADDVRARQICMDHRLRGSLRLMPVEVVEVTESSVRRPPVVPVCRHGDLEIIVGRHSFPHSARVRATGLSKPHEGDGQPSD